MRIDEFGLRNPGGDFAGDLDVQGGLCSGGFRTGGAFFQGVDEEIQAELHFHAGFDFLAFEVAHALFEQLTI